MKLCFIVCVNVISAWVFKSTTMQLQLRLKKKRLNFNLLCSLGHSNLISCFSGKRIIKFSQYIGREINNKSHIHTARFNSLPFDNVVCAFCHLIDT